MLVEPSASRDYYTLVTAGASNHKFPIHIEGTHTESDSDSECFELFINLPKDWRFDDKALNKLKMRWPLEHLRSAVIDTINTNAIYHGGVLPFIPMCEPIPFFGLMLLSSMKEFEEFETLQVSPGRQIDFYNLFPVHFNEWDWVFDNGAKALEKVFLKNGFAGAIDINRKSVNTEL
ncbi:suppressor of fused domain protein [Pontiellaceae bacterium B12227]|nr:suppressor of fused domain protein [Pontiellaceae bacterium B12227]